MDLRDHGSGTAAERREAARLAAEACRTTGLFLLTGHGVRPGLVRDAQRAAEEFFAAGEDYKARFRVPGSSRGYAPMSTESLAATAGAETPPDVKEAFAFGAVDVPENRAAWAGAGLTAVVWPRRPPEFRDALLAYYRAAHLLAGRLMALLADALDAPAGFFADKLDRSADFLRVINYPRQAVEPPPGALRAGAHTDFGALTVIAADDAPGGLQVRDPDGRWIDVPAPAGTFVVNIGDLMAYWTGNRWASAVHRVVNPPPGSGPETRRQSLVFFHNPNLDAVIEPLDRAARPGAPPPVPITTRRWLADKTLRQRVPAR
ncbi:2OG-Fe(II) oxygenase family protein [Spirillospora sp. NPDC029432]|uniref:isopenicillin N synthase family dioxygenase n=1 Tax=Spirillospora sp. NPDC029432 TaxID=3154599 RepID=UPI003457217C